MIVILLIIINTVYPGQKQFDNSPVPSMFIKTNDTGQRDNKKKLMEASLSSAKEIALIHSEKGFYPQKIYLKANQKTRLFITGVTGKETSFIIDEMKIYKGISSGKVSELDLVPSKQGVFKFYCPITNKKGWVIVR